MMIEIMRLLYTSDVVEIYVIVTSDSDYRHVVSETKCAEALLLHRIGEYEHSLQNICDKFVKLENISKNVSTDAQTNAKDAKKKMKKMGKILQRYRPPVGREAVCLYQKSKTSGRRSPVRSKRMGFSKLFCLSFSLFWKQAETLWEGERSNHYRV